MAAAATVTSSAASARSCGCFSRRCSSLRSARSFSITSNSRFSRSRFSAAARSRSRHCCVRIPTVESAAAVRAWPLVAVTLLGAGELTKALLVLMLLPLPVSFLRYKLWMRQSGVPSSASRYVSTEREVPQSAHLQQAWWNFLSS